MKVTKTPITSLIALIAVLIVVLVDVGTASAATPLILPYHVMTAGNGCTAGRATVKTSDSGATVHLKMGTSPALVGSDAGMNFSRKACTVAIAAEVPAGFQLGMIAPALKVSHQLSDGAAALYHAEYFIAGGTVNESPVGARRFTSAEAGTETQATTLSLSTAPVWSECSLQNESVIFRINSSVNLQTDSDSSSSAALRGFEADQIQFVLRACS